MGWKANGFTEIFLDTRKGSFENLFSIFGAVPIEQTAFQIATGRMDKMFNPEKMLGGLLRGGMHRSSGGLGSLVKGGAALGLLGVAMEDRKSTRLNSSHRLTSRMPSSA
jgi:hypothetical protein